MNVCECTDKHFQSREPYNVFEELEVRGELRPSNRYRLAAGALNLDLWYSHGKTCAIR
jgi:hypothetical protein